MIKGSQLTMARTDGMHHFFITFAFLGCILSAHGLSVEIPVTPTNLDQTKYIFAISTNATAKGVQFYIKVTAKRDDIPSDSGAGLSIVTHTKEGSGSTHSIEGVKPAPPITLKKGKRIWEAGFMVSYELLKKPGLCFVFTEMAHAKIDGKIVTMPSADFYEMKLQNFLKQ